MSYDIYGENLKRGHCEVHPYVAQEYPSNVCMTEKHCKANQDAKRLSQKSYEQILAQRDELLNSLKDIRSSILNSRYNPEMDNIISGIDAAIAKAVQP